MKTVPVTLQPLPKREHLRVLICGELGSGRSSFSTTFPHAVVVDASGTLYARDDRPDVPILRTADPDDIEALIAQIKDGLMRPDTFVIDGACAVSEYIEKTVPHLKGYESWAAVRDRWTTLLRAIFSLNCNVVLTTRLKQEYARAGQVFGGRLVTDMERIVVGTMPELHKSLPEYFDIVFEMVRGASGRAMAAVKSSTLREFECDEVVVPDAPEILKRIPSLTTVDREDDSSPPAPEDLAAFLRLQEEVKAASISDALLSEIKTSCCQVKGRKTKYLTAGETSRVAARYKHFLEHGEPPTPAVVVEQPVEETPATAASTTSADSAVADAAVSVTSTIPEPAAPHDTESVAAATTVPNSTITANDPAKAGSEDLLIIETPAGDHESKPAPAPGTIDPASAPPAPEPEKLPPAQATPAPIGSNKHLNHLMTRYNALAPKPMTSRAYLIEHHFIDGPDAVPTQEQRLKAVAHIEAAIAALSAPPDTKPPKLGLPAHLSTT